MAHFKHYLEVFRHHLNCFWPFQWKWKENVIFNKICLLFWTPFCNWPYSGHIYYLENVPVGPISPVWPLNVIWDFKNLIWSHKISIEIVLLLRHCGASVLLQRMWSTVFLGGAQRPNKFFRRGKSWRVYKRSLLFELDSRTIRNDGARTWFWVLRVLWRWGW